MIRNKLLIDNIDEYGRVVLSVDEALDAMLQGDTLSHFYIDDSEEHEQYVNSCKTFGEESVDIFRLEYIRQSPDDYLKSRAKRWLIPKEYQKIDVLEYLLERCKTDEEVRRVALEVSEFVDREQLIILNLMIYLVEVMRQNKIVWGVGRGSSVACFCLYLIGINKINPLEYDIDYEEFFK